MKRPGSRAAKAAAVGAAGMAVLAGGCGGVQVRRDLSAVTPAQVIFDDMCKLQGYFDAIDGQQGDAPKVVQDTSMEKDVGKRAAGGRSVFAFEGPFQLTALRRVLDENWAELPAALGSARRVEIQVRWSEKAGVQRAVTTDAAVMTVAGGKAVDIPYQHCLSDFLFGASLYRTRRNLLGLASAVPPPLPAPPIVAPTPPPAAPAPPDAPAPADPAVKTASGDAPPAAPPP